MRVLVTGANGHVGCNLVRELIARGHAVVALVRPNADVRGLQGLPIEISRGDVLDESAVEAAAQGCDAIVNLAATYQIGETVEHIVEPAVKAVRNVLNVAARRGMARVVHTSSIVAVGTSDAPDAVRDETCWNDRPHDAYFLAKTESERQAWALAKEKGVALVCVNPAGVLGPYDYRATPTTAYAEQLASGTTQTVPGGLNYVDVGDVALIHALALEKGVPGERYIVAGENLDFRQFAARVTALTGRRVPHANLPRWAILAYAAVVEGFDRGLGRSPRITRSSATENAWRWAVYDTTKARTAFDWSPRPVDATIADTIRWGVFLGRVPADGLDAALTTPDPAWVK